MTDQIRPVPEPDLELMRALAVADALYMHRPETPQDRQQLERMRTAPDRESLLEACHEYAEHMHMPTDAGVWEEGLVGILRRIPPRWRHRALAPAVRVTFPDFAPCSGIRSPPGRWLDGVDVMALQRALGHTTVDQVNRYVHHQKEDLLAAWARRSG